MLIVGAQGSGKYTLAKEICNIIGAEAVDVKTDTESIKAIVYSVQNNMDKTAYIIRHIDEVSIMAANALLKIVEEPPHNAYFILTTSDTGGVLKTIVSRSCMINMSPYSKAELREVTNDELLVECCKNIGEVLYWKDKDFKAFVNLCSDVAINITSRTGVDTLRISQMVDETVMYQFATLVFAQLKLSRGNALQAFKLTTSAKDKLRSKSFNKTAIIDLWLTDIRQLLRG